MEAITELLRLSPAIYALISAPDCLVYAAGSVFITVVLFRLRLRRASAVYAAAVLLCAAAAAADTYAAFRQDDIVSFLAAVLGVATPYLCMALLFRRRGHWKAMLVTAGYTFVEAVRFLLLLLFFNLTTTTATNRWS